MQSHTTVKPGALVLVTARDSATKPGTLALATLETLRTTGKDDGNAAYALADLRALLAERDAAVQHAERLAAAMESMDRWESDGRPVPIHVQMQVVRAALAAWREVSK